MRRALARAEAADLKIVVIDAAEPASAIPPESLALIDTDAVVAANKADIAVASQIRSLAETPVQGRAVRSEEHTSELQSLMRISYAVFCLKKQNKLQK